MTELAIRYELTGSGWAAATLSCGDAQVVMTASYLHDSLQQLAEATIALSNGAPSATVLFMDEPGEHQLSLRREAIDEQLVLEVSWFSDWHSWGHAAKRTDGVFRCETTIGHLRAQVIEVLRALLREHGVDGYVRRWVEHPFPAAELELLSGDRVPRPTPKKKRKKKSP